VFGPDGRRPPARHAARSSLGRRRFMFAIAVLVALASVPSLAVVIAGAASLESTPGARSPYVADGPDGPVRVDPDGNARIRAGERPSVTIEPAQALPSPVRRPSAPVRRSGPSPEAGAVGAPASRAESCSASPSSAGGTSSTPQPGVDPPPGEPSPSPTVERRRRSFGLDLGIIGIRFG